VPEKSKHTIWVEVLATVLMALTTIATAWCAFQSNRWNSEQTFFIAEANTMNRQAMENSVKGNQMRVLDVAMFMQYLAAFHNNKTELADYYRQHFRPEMKQAFDAWINSKNEGTGDVVPHPFLLKEYTLALEIDAKILSNSAAQKLQQAKRANQYSGWYVMLTVFFASVLFFSGMATKFESVAIQKSVVVMGMIVFLSVIGILVTYPVAG